MKSLKTINKSFGLQPYVSSHSFSTTAASLNYNYGYDTQKGPRSYMEDFIVHTNNFSVDNSLISSGNHSLFGVFDGHGGSKCSQYIANNIQSYLATNMQKHSNIQQVFEHSMIEMDDYVSCIEKKRFIQQGSTACVTLIDNVTNKIIISNVGDSRCLKIDKNNKITQLTVDHHPLYHEFERRRLIKLGELSYRT
eukprot:552436_1